MLYYHKQMSIFIAVVYIQRIIMAANLLPHSYSQRSNKLKLILFFPWSGVCSSRSCLNSKLCMPLSEICNGLWKRDFPSCFFAYCRISGVRFFLNLWKTFFWWWGTKNSICTPKKKVTNHRHKYLKTWASLYNSQRRRRRW